MLAVGIKKSSVIALAVALGCTGVPCESLAVTPAYADTPKGELAQGEARSANEAAPGLDDVVNPSAPDAPTEEPGETPGSEPTDPSPTPDPAPLIVPAPLISQVGNASDAIEITWDQVQGAAGYCLFRKRKGDDDWKQVATLQEEINSYRDYEVVTGDTCYYRLRALGADGSLSAYGPKVSVKRLVAPEGLMASATVSGMGVSWTPAVGAGGYRIYRQREGSNTWALVAELASGNTRYWLDNSVVNGVLYRYSVAAYSGTSESAVSSPAEFCFVSAPRTTSLKRKNSKSYLAKWSKNSKATGYQLQYSKSSVFLSRKTLKMSGAAATQKTLKGLASKKTYYVRVRAYMKKNGKTYYSSWSCSSNAKKARSLSLSLQKRKSATFELRAQAKQAMYGYDTVQGSCTDGAYGYYCLYNRNVEKCKIAKVKLSTMKVVKVSKVLDVAHGNDMAYDSNRKSLIIAHATGSGKRLSTVDPATLKIARTADVAVPKGLSGATEAQRKAVKSFNGVTYNKSRDQYMVLLGGSHDFMLLNGDMQPVRYVPASYKSAMVYQGIDSTDNYLFVAVSPRTARQSNAILVYTWDGGFVGRLKLKGIDEIESVYHIGSKFYASVYRSYYKTYYTKQKKTVKIKGKKKVKTVKVRHRVLRRDNYVYRVKDM